VNLWFKEDILLQKMWGWKPEIWISLRCYALRYWNFEEEAERNPSPVTAYRVYMGMKAAETKFGSLSTGKSMVQE
jgi:hypothetical protein